MQLGDTFVLAVDGAHLWIVVSLPSADGSVALVNLTTKKPNCDTNCVVEAGEHPFVKHPSVVAYQYARIANSVQQAGFEKNSSPRQAVTPALLARVQEGALKSDLTPAKVETAIRASIEKQKKA